MDQQQQKAIQQVYGNVTRALRQGQPPEVIVENLSNQGIPHETAIAIVNKVQASGVAQPTTAPPKMSNRMGGMKNLGIGIVLLVLGVIVTAGTYMVAEPGGTFMVTTGLFVVGGINMLIGLFRFIFGM
jgi:hypothetical protein